MEWKWDGGVMCFSPTMEEFQDFSGFVRCMEELGAHKYGVAKVSFQLVDWLVVKSWLASDSHYLSRLYHLLNGSLGLPTWT